MSLNMEKVFYHLKRYGGIIERSGVIRLPGVSALESLLGAMLHTMTSSNRPVGTLHVSPEGFNFQLRGAMPPSGDHPVFMLPPAPAPDTVMLATLRSLREFARKNHPEVPANALQMLDRVLDRTDWTPMTREAIFDLTAEAWAAPCTDEYMVGLEPIIRAFEACLRESRQPRDPAKTRDAMPNDESTKGAPQ